jgi:hypothetical protein
MGGTAGQDYFPCISWNRQHNHHLLANSLLLFNNNGTNGSTAVEYSTAGDSTTPLFSYSSGAQPNTLGDAKRLPNGNTLVTYSNAGLIQEVNPAGQLVQSMSTNGLGYTLRRRTLYGPPPPYAE